MFYKRDQYDACLILSFYLGIAVGVPNAVFHNFSQEICSSVAIFCQITPIPQPGNFMSGNLKDFDTNVMIQLMIYKEVKTQKRKTIINF
jgi:FtsZ-interacting cell division protein ZipA